MDKPKLSSGAVKPGSRSQLNVGFGADCGRSRGGPRRGAIRPTETSTESVSTRPLKVDPRHSIARDQRPLRVKPKSARDYS